MQRITISLATGLCLALATSVPVLADNTATGSTGTAQIGSVTASPTGTLGTPAGDATVAAPAGSTSQGTGGSNHASRSTGTVQSSPFALTPRAGVSRGTARASGSAPIGVTGGDNSASGSTGTAQVGGGNSATDSTGAAQAGGVQAAPSATFGPAGGGNSATGSTGSAQSNGLPLQPFSALSTGLHGTGADQMILGLPVSNTGGPESSSHPQAKAAAPVGGQSLSGRRTGAAQRTPGCAAAAPMRPLSARVLGALPFTGRDLLVLIGLAVVGTGVMRRRRGAAVI